MKFCLTVEVKLAPPISVTPFLVHMAKQEALRSVDFADVRKNGAEFMEEHPGMNAKNLQWGSRAFNRGARDAFTLAVMSEHHHAITKLGARPCCICGSITCGWCEGCDGPDRWAVCAFCDDNGILCHGCTSDGKLWHRLQKSSSADIAEVSGFMDDGGHFISFHPVLKVDLSQVPASEAQDYLEAKILEHYEKMQADHKPSTAS